MKFRHLLTGQHFQNPNNSKGLLVFTKDFEGKSNLKIGNQPRYFQYHYHHGCEVIPSTQDGEYLSGWRLTLDYLLHLLGKF